MTNAPAKRSSFWSALLFGVAVVAIVRVLTAILQ